MQVAPIVGRVSSGAGDAPSGVWPRSLCAARSWVRVLPVTSLLRTGAFCQLRYTDDDELNVLAENCELKTAL